MIFKSFTFSNKRLNFEKKIKNDPFWRKNLKDINATNIETGKLGQIKNTEIKLELNPLKCMHGRQEQ